jgi:hypothetical protein
MQQQQQQQQLRTSKMYIARLMFESRLRTPSCEYYMHHENTI